MVHRWSSRHARSDIPGMGFLGADEAVIRRYVTRFADIDNNVDAETYMSREVHEPDPSPRESGLLDAQGNKLYSVLELGPIGYVKFALK